jgi:hypothetical protein
MILLGDIDCLSQMLSALVEDENNVRKLDAAREEAGNDMIEVMRLVFPIVVDIQVECVAKVNPGVPRNKEGYGYMR